MSGTAVCPSCGRPVAPEASFCSACGTALGDAAREERKLATILFADVIGSTDLGEQLDPERLRSLLGDYFAAMAVVVKAWGGTIEKYIGDAILAVWGVPNAREDDAVRALNAARDMITGLDRLNADFEARHGVRLGVRIGVNTGEVIAPVASRPGGQFLVSGDAVNVAARLEQSAEPGSVLVGERTWLSARHEFEFSPAVLLSVKGKREPIVARPLGQPVVASVQRTPFQAPMVGRDRELATLLGLLDEAIESGQPRLVVLSGPAGIGKSRMLRELIAEAGERFDKLLVLRGRCVAAGHGITFWALGEILRAACSISLDDPADAAAQKLEQSVAGPLGAMGLGGDEIALTVGALATTANLPLANNPLEGLDPEAVFEQMSRAWPRFLTALARTWPLAVMVEDIHWADERLLMMLELLAARSQGRLLLVATARPEFVESHPGFGAGQDVSVVSLRPLTGSQSDRLIDELVGSSNIPDALVSEMRAKADGNPFFLEEMLQRLVDEGALVYEAGRWHATERAAGVQLSDSVHGLLAARIDALPIHEKQFLQEAAVVGRIFWPGALARAVGPALPDVDLAGVLQSLERRGLISARPTSTLASEPEYMFRHVLIHDVAYGSVPKARRARAHADVGRWIEDLAGERLDEFGELIAYHYSAAVLADDADLAWADLPRERDEVTRRAFEMLLRAGASARHRSAIDKALQLHGEAAALATTDAERALAHEELADDHEALFRGDEAVAEYLAAIDYAAGLPDNQELIARLVAKAARMTLRWGGFREEPPIDRIEALIAASLETPVSDPVRATLLIASAGLARGPYGSPIGTGRVLIRIDEMPDLGARIESVEEGLAIARRLDDAGLQQMAYELLSNLFMSSGQEERYRETCEQALVLLERLQSHREQVDLLVSVAGARADAGRYASALEAAEDALARSADLSPHDRMHAAWEVYRAAEPMGRWDRILELLPWYAGAASSEGEITCAAVRAGPALGATVLARRGDPEGAQEFIPVADLMGLPGTFGGGAVAALYATTVERTGEAWSIAKQTLEHVGERFVSFGAPPMLDVLAALDRLDDLARFLPVARESSQGNVQIEPTAQRAEALLRLRGHETDPEARAEAERLMRAALTRFEELGAPFQAARTAEMLAEIVDHERLQFLRRALTGYESLGARPYAGRIRAQLEADKPAAV